MLIDTAPRHRPRRFLALLLLACAACANGEVSGRYVDYDIGDPIAGATVRVTRYGWGVSNGQLIWDKATTTTGFTREDGGFTVAAEGTLHLEARGYQVLTGISPGKALLLQGKRLRAGPRTIAGGVLKLGRLADGRPFGWNFAEDRIALQPEDADLFPADMRLLPDARVVLHGHGAGVLFVPGDEQRIAVSSYGAYLRYLDRPPSRPFTDAAELKQAGTLFVRTRDGRFAKVAFDPSSLATGAGGELDGAAAGLHVLLPFAYQPYPIDDLYFDPFGDHGTVLPEVAGAAAQLPPGGPPPSGPRRYRFTVVTKEGREVEAVELTLAPDRPASVAAWRGRRLLYRLENVTLAYRPDGIAGVRLSISGDSFVHHLDEILPNKRFDARREFHDWRGGRARPLDLRVRELGL